MKTHILLWTTWCWALLWSQAQEPPVQELSLYGVQTIHHYVPNGLVSLYIVWEGGCANYDTSEAGIEALAIKTALRSGIQALPGGAFEDALSIFGIRIQPVIDRHYAGFAVSFPSEFADTALYFLSRLILNPIFDSATFEQVRARQIAEVQSMLANPDYAIQTYSITYTFADSDYEKLPEGTPSTLKRLTYHQTRHYYFHRLRIRNRTLLVVVGDLPVEKLLRWQDLNHLPQDTRPIQWNLPQHLYIKQSTLTTIPRPNMATNYIRGMTGAPPMNTPDEMPYRLAFAILDDRLFIELRTKRNLTYAPAAYVASSMRVPYGVVYASTTLPDSAVRVMLATLRHYYQEGFTEKEVRQAQALFRTYHYLRQEGNSNLAHAYVRAQLIEGDWHRVLTFNKRVKNTTVQDVTDAYRKYLQGIRWYYLGNPEAIQDRRLWEEEIR